MIDRTHPLPVVRQSQLLKLARSTAYYQPTPVSETTLALMRRIDELYLHDPFAGARMLRDLLRQEGHAIGRRQVATRMCRMGIEALYRKPSLSRRQSGHQLYPYLLCDLVISRRIMSGRRLYHLHSDSTGLRLSLRRARLGESPGIGVAVVQHAYDRLLSGRSSRGHHPIWHSDHLQYRPRVPIHEPGVRCP